MCQEQNVDGSTHRASINTRGLLKNICCMTETQRVNSQRELPPGRNGGPIMIVESLLGLTSGVICVGSFVRG